MTLDDLIRNIEDLRRVASQLNISPTPQDLSDSITVIRSEGFLLGIAYTVERLYDGLVHCRYRSNPGPPVIIQEFEKLAHELMAELAKELSKEIKRSASAPAPR